MCLAWIPHVFPNWNSNLQKISFLSIYLLWYQCKFMDSYFIQWIIIRYCYFLNFNAQIVLDLVSGSFFKVAPILFGYIPIILSRTSLFSGIVICSVLTLFFPWSSLRICREPWKDVFRNQDLGIKFAHCYLGVIILRPS